MTTFAVLAAGGALTWVLRVALIAFTPSAAVAERIADALRYAPPAAFATLIATSLAVAAHNTGHEVWRYAVAAAVTAATARFAHNLVVALLAGAATVTALTLR